MLNVKQIRWSLPRPSELQCIVVENKEFNQFLLFELLLKTGAGCHSG